MKKQQELLRYSTYQTENKKKELAYYWTLTTGENSAEICELHLGNMQKKVCTFTLPDLRGIKKEGNEQEYIEGLVKVKYDCFKEAQDIKNLRVVLPQTYSYRFERGEFTNNFCPDKTVTIVMPQRMRLFEVSDGVKSWILAADERLGDYCEFLGKKVEPLNKKKIKEIFGYNLNADYNGENEGAEKEYFPE